jgi:uncharacterized protein (TIGR02145 family)
MTEGIYTARVIASADGYCEATMSGSPTISRNSLPTQPAIAKPDDVCLNGGDIVFTASGYSGSLTWTSNGGGSVNGNSVTFASGAATGTKTVIARSAQTYSNAPVCYSGTVTQSATVNTLPTVASSAGAARCGSGTLTLTATPSADAVIDWYSVATGDAVLSGGSATNSFTTPSISASTVYYAEARIVATGCVSSSRTAVTATINAVPTINTHPATSATTCTGSTVQLTVSASNATGYQWRKNGANVSDGSGGTSANYTTGILNGNATYTVVVNNASCTVTSSEAYITTTGTAPNSTVNFTAFDPCPNAAIGTVWYLTDMRESGVSPSNTQTYKVRKMADGRIWMVQDLKFGNLCGTDFRGSTSNQTGKVTSLTDKTYYGDCRNNTQSVAAGYLYDWAAAINKLNAYYGSSSNVGCSGIGSGTSGTNPGACQGICPVGWHIPTSGSSGEFQDADAKFKQSYLCSNAGCWNASSPWEGVQAGACTNTGVLHNPSDWVYWSSTYGNGYNNYTLALQSGTLLTSYLHSTHFGGSVRCVRNY